MEYKLLHTKTYTNIVLNKTTPYFKYHIFYFTGHVKFMILGYKMLPIFEHHIFIGAELITIKRREHKKYC